MSRFSRGLIALAAVVAIAAGALIVLPRLLPGDKGGGSSANVPTQAPTAAPTPTPSPTPSPTPTVVPSPTLAPTVEPSLSPSPSPSAGAVATPACAGGDLAARVMDWQGAAGTRFGTISLRNMGTISCLVSGTPGLQLVDGQGQVFLDSANLGNPASASPAKPVFTLPAGGASSIYLMAGLANYCGADPVAPVRLALVFPANLGRVVSTAAAGVEITMAPCNGSTLATELHVQVPWSTTAP